MDDANAKKNLEAMKGYVSLLYSGMKDLRNRLSELVPERLSVVDANIWSFSHDLDELRRALIVALDEESTEEQLEQALVSLKAHHQEDISEHIKRREEQRKAKLAERQSSEASTENEEPSGSENDG